jgi:hypothetical protein
VFVRIGKVRVVVSSVIPSGGKHGVSVSIKARLQVIQASVYIPLHGIKLFRLVPLHFSSGDLDLHQSDFAISTDFYFVSISVAQTTLTESHGNRQPWVESALDCAINDQFGIFCLLFVKGVEEGVFVFFHASILLLGQAKSATNIGSSGR